MANKKEFENKKRIYLDLLKKFRNCGNLHLEERWDMVEERYKLMRTDTYIKAIESVMCEELQMCEDALVSGDEQ